LGYNTLATIYYIQKNNLDIKLNIYSPEFDIKLLKSLKDFQYPQEFQPFKNIIKQLSSTFKYQDNKINIEIFQGDARKYIKTLSNIDIIYQDPFSSDVNKSLWTVEYFEDIYKLLSSNGIVTTYSIATPVRLNMYENNFFIYEYQNNFTKKLTIALKTKLKNLITNYKYIDMELKKSRNPTAISFGD